MTLAQLEVRLATLEEKFAMIAAQGQASAAPAVNAWIDEIHGTFADDKAYRQAAHLGRKWRKAHLPASPRTRKASK
jgi:hypothetical protein